MITNPSESINSLANFCVLLGLTFFNWVVTHSHSHSHSHKYLSIRIVSSAFLHHARIYYSFLVCHNQQPVTNAVLTAPPTWHAKAHVTYKRSQNKLENPRYIADPERPATHKLRTFRPATREFKNTNKNNNHRRRPRQPLTMNRDVNASRNMIYKALCMLQNLPFAPCFVPRPRN